LVEAIGGVGTQVKLRTAKAAHPQMREVVIPLLKWFKKLIPVIFDDIEVEK
jgi:thymidylate synthase (FAD)